MPVRTVEGSASIAAAKPNKKKQGFRSGTAALREIRKYQTTGPVDLVLKQTPFQSLVKELCYNVNDMDKDLNGVQSVEQMPEDQKAFYESERSKLAAIGITDPIRQNEEMAQRWNFLQRNKSRPKPPAAGGISVRWTKEAILSLQEATEAYVVKLFEDATLDALHGKRVAVICKDMQLARRIRRERETPFVLWDDDLEKAFANIALEDFVLWDDDLEMAFTFIALEDAEDIRSTEPHTPFVMWDDDLEKAFALIGLDDNL